MCLKIKYQKLFLKIKIKINCEYIYIYIIKINSILILNNSLNSCRNYFIYTSKPYILTLTQKLYIINIKYAILIVI